MPEREDHSTPTDNPKDAPTKHTGPAATSPYPVSRLAPAFDIVDVAREIAQADHMLGRVTEAKLHVIAEQMRALKAQAEDILAGAQHNAQLHRARCNFERRAGQVYHLYERTEQDRYFSLVSPAEWRGSPPHPYVGSFKLELDMSWTQVDQATGASQTSAAQTRQPDAPGTR